MNFRLQLIKKQLEVLRLILHLLLNFKNPTDKIVVYCSQKLDVVIVNYHKVKTGPPVNDSCKFMETYPLYSKYR